MKGDKYLANVDRLLANNRALGVMCAVLVAVNLLNMGFTMRMASRVETVILPPGGEEMKIGNGKADSAYIRRMARYVTGMLGSYTAATARNQFQEVLQLWSPATITEAARYFDGVVADIERYPSIASNVLWNGTEPLKFTKDLIQVQVMKERMVNGTVSDRKQAFYCIKYHIDGSKFAIVNITEKEGTGIDLCYYDEAKAKKAAEENPASGSAAP